LTWHECGKFEVLIEPDAATWPDVDRGTENIPAAGRQPNVASRVDTRILVDRTIMP
jgi:hypothetical protein